MKSLILKDLYNIGHNTKSMFLFLLIFAVFFIPSGASIYVMMSSIMCTTMIVTTFSFDETSKWIRYALVMPISKKDIVLGKFVTLALFCIIGNLFGLVVGSVGEFFIHNFTFNNDEILSLLTFTLTAFIFSFTFGCFLIPLMFKFGPEKGRMLMILALLVPTGIGYGGYHLLKLMGVQFTDNFITLLLCCAPLFVLIWFYLMYHISYRIFSKQEF